MSLTSFESKLWSRNLKEFKEEGRDRTARMSVQLEQNARLAGATKY